MYSNNLISRSSLNVPVDINYMEPLTVFAESYARQLDLSESQTNNLQKAVSKVLNILIDNSHKDFRRPPIHFEIGRKDNHLVVRFVNHGHPLFLAGTVLSHQLSLLADGFSFVNNGRDGQELTFVYELTEEPVSHLTSVDLPKESDQRELFYRPIKPSESSHLSQLFYSVYGYNYVQDYVYYPGELSKKIESGELLTFGAFLDDEVMAGHIGLLRKNNDPTVYEAALGVVDPRIKSRGIFKTLFSQVMKHVDDHPMQYCLYDFVTNHDFSQKEVNKYETCALSLHLGCQISETQAKLETLGIGKDSEEMDRYTLLVAVKPKVEQPFGKEVILPINIGEQTEFLLDPLNISWRPAPRFSPLPKTGTYAREINYSQKSIHFELENPAQDLLQPILNEWKHFLRLGFMYASVDIPLTTGGLALIYDFFVSHGFFLSGFVPYRHSNVLALRLQSLGPSRIAIDDLKIYGAQGQQLYQLIKNEYLRSQSL